ncbi:hypothetical protein D7X94_08160 [Acutalibacter sp. 1XD8-33]|nr:hypothetical protein D7X94_08160 [Acutalibacter sp. 1XD8-33]
MTRLPEVPVKAVLVSGEYPRLISALQRLGITTISTKRDFRLPEPVSWHPDMQVCLLKEKMFVLRASPTKEILWQAGLPAQETEKSPGKWYPQDVLCNVLAWDNYVMGNLKTADPNIVSMADKLGMQWLAVKQGYTACSTVLVDHSSAITADLGVSRQLNRNGMRVLEIQPGCIGLPGYDTGLLGGCCGKIAPDKLVFSGQLDSHPEGWIIREFLASREIQAIELLPGELIDVGGIMAVL